MWSSHGSRVANQYNVIKVCVYVCVCELGVCKTMLNTLQVYVPVCVLQCTHLQGIINRFI